MPLYLPSLAALERVHDGEADALRGLHRMTIRQMGITLRGLRSAMPEQCTDDRERQTIGQSKTRETVPEIVLPDIHEARFLAHKSPDRLRSAIRACARIVEKDPGWVQSRQTFENIQDLRRDRPD